MHTQSSWCPYRFQSEMGLSHTIFNKLILFFAFSFSVFINTTCYEIYKLVYYAYIE